MDKIREEDHNQLINQAYENVMGLQQQAAADPHRLQFHMMAPANWMNDPNGLIQFKGEYHLFYQHHPYSAKWGPMHWGHAVSRDLVCWEHLPIALAPSESFDLDGCFSGSAVDDEGTLTLMYTGIAPEGSLHRQIQCLAMSEDGRTFSKFDGNPVIGAPPVDGSEDFRDPKAWKHEGQWYVVIGSGKEGIGNVLLYRSADLREWQYVGVVAESDGTQGAIWECPDLFALGDKYVLVVSPNVEKAKNIYMIGDFDYTTGKFVQESMGELDYGFDYYAAQSFEDDTGRRIVIGWMDIWGANMPTQAYGWAGAMTVPRVLSLLPDGALSVLPVPELHSLRKEPTCFNNIVVDSGSSGYLGELRGDCLELIAEFELPESRNAEFGLKVRCSSDGREETRFGYRVAEGELIVDRSRSGLDASGISRCGLSLPDGETLKLHIYLDRSSVEVFSNEGRGVISNRIYPGQDSLGVDLYVSEGRVRLIKLEVWKLKPIWNGCAK